MSPQTPSSNSSSLHKWLKFRTRQSSTLWALYAAAMALIFIARLPLIFPNGLRVNLSREEYFNFSVSLNEFMLFSHLASVFPAGLLAVTQFVPRIRSRFISYHRAAGTVINVLSVISTLSAWYIARVSFGGDLSIQLGVYVVGLTTLWSMVASWRAIRRLQIDEHRKWIIRSWSYQMSVVTLRLILFPSMAVTGLRGGWYITMSCAEVANSLQSLDIFAREYPQCLPGSLDKPVTHVAVEAGLNSGLAIAAAARVGFGMSIWVAFWIHAVGTEYYLFKTKDESDRLREVSAKRQNIRHKLHETKNDETRSAD